jgi:hypothetical protein
MFHFEQTAKLRIDMVQEPMRLADTQRPLNKEDAQ